MRGLRRGVVASSLAVVLAAPVDGLVAAEAGSVQFDVTKNGAPDSGVEIALNAANLGKVALATTDSRGGAAFALDAANLGKARVEVVTEECPTHDRVWLVGPGGQLPPETKECKRRAAGGFFWGQSHVSVDVSRGTVVARADEASKSGRSSRTLGLALVGVGAAVAIFGFATKSKEPGVTDCATEGQSACSSRTGVGIAGLAIAGAGGYVLYRNSHSSAEITLPAGGGIGFQERIRF
jgi:hypothetical protein